MESIFSFLTFIALMLLILEIRSMRKDLATDSIEHNEAPVIGSDKFHDIIFVDRDDLEFEFSDKSIYDVYLHDFISAKVFTQEDANHASVIIFTDRDMIKVLKSKHYDKLSDGIFTKQK